jgi:hypothetical protein
MSEALLIEETGERAAERLQSALTLVVLAFEAGEARARARRLEQPSRIIDAIASACFGEARELLTRPVDELGQLRGNLFTALFALDAAASREPECYASTYQTLRKFALAALDEVVALELANAEDLQPHEQAESSERWAN